nr:hypothetical protein [uncultured Tolumonas sp.]
MTHAIADYVGKIILIKFIPGYVESAQSLIQPNDAGCSSFYVRLAGVETAGIWVENKQWQTQDFFSTPPDVYHAAILIPWQQIESIAAFPDREFSHGEEPYREKDIGFLAAN